MTERAFSERSWTIRSSTSRFFPIESEIVLKPKEPTSDGFELEVTWEGHPETVINKDFHQVESGRALRGKFSRPKDPKKRSLRHFEIVVTPSPIDANGKQWLFGLLVEVRGRDDVGTGVWVAEAKPPEPQE